MNELQIKEYNSLLKGFSPNCKYNIINTVNKGLALWNDVDMITYGDIRNTNFTDIARRALTKRGYFLIDEEIDDVKNFINSFGFKEIEPQY